MSFDDQIDIMAMLNAQTVSNTLLQQDDDDDEDNESNYSIEDQQLRRQASSTTITTKHPEQQKQYGPRIIVSYSQQALSQQQQHRNYYHHPHHLSGKSAKYVAIFISQLDDALSNQREERLLKLYLTNYFRISQKIFRTQLWPDLIDDSQHNINTLTRFLYHELRMRHLYSHKNPTNIERIESWENFANLIDQIQDQSQDIKVFPLQWAWDILDQFLYQFQGFCYAVQISVKHGKQEQFLGQIPETQDQEESKQAASIQNRLPKYWSMEGVSQILDSFIHEVAEFNEEQEIIGIRSSKPQEDLASSLGFFAFVCKIRYFIANGEFDTALELLAMINPKKKHQIYNKVMPCYVSLYYHAGYTFLMKHHYIEAIKAFSNVLVFANRAKNLCARSYQYDSLNKCQEQSLQLLSIALALCPWKGIDSQVHQMLHDHRHENTFVKLQNGNLEMFVEKLKYGSPKFFVSAQQILMDNDHSVDQIQQLQKDMIDEFMREIQDQRQLARLHKLLESYSELTMVKLSKLMGLDIGETEKLIQKLKDRFMQTVIVSNEGGFDVMKYGVKENFEDPKFDIKGNSISIQHSKKDRNIIADFERAIDKIRELQGKIV